MENKLSFIVNNKFFTKSGVTIDENKSTLNYCKETIKKIEETVDSSITQFIFQDNDLFVYGFVSDSSWNINKYLVSCNKETLFDFLVDPNFIYLHELSVNTSNVDYEPSMLLENFPNLYEILPLNSTQKVREFLELLLNDMDINFHPDDPFENFLTDNNTLVKSNGEVVKFDKIAIDFINNLIQHCFEIEGDNLYVVGLEILNERLGIENTDSKINDDLAKLLCEILFSYDNVKNTWDYEDKKIVCYPFENYFTFENIKVEKWITDLLKHSNISISDIKNKVVTSFTSAIERFANSLLNVYNYCIDNDDETINNYKEIYPFSKSLDDVAMNLFDCLPEKGLEDWLVPDVIEMANEIVNSSGNTINLYSLNNRANLINIYCKNNGIKNPDGISRAICNILFETYGVEELKKQIITFVNAKVSFFTQEETDEESELRWTTRENGDIVSEEPGYDDIIAAKELKKSVEKEFASFMQWINVSIETVDEWTYFNIEFIHE